MADYDASKVVIAFGEVIIDGFADGDFITIARDNPSFTNETGADGQGVRSASNDKRGTVTLTLQQTSLANTQLAAIVKSDELGLLGKRPFACRDLLGTTVATAGSMWIEKPADTTFGRESGTREWVLKTNNLELLPGGALV
jgi:hypothetical protein